MVYHTMLLLQRKYRIISSGRNLLVCPFLLCEERVGYCFSYFHFILKNYLYKIFISKIQTFLQLLSQHNDVLNHTLGAKPVPYILLRHYYTNLATAMFYSSLKHIKLDSYRPVQCLCVFCGPRPGFWDSGDSHRPVP